MASRIICLICEIGTRYLKKWVALAASFSGFGIAIDKRCLFVDEVAFGEVNSSRLNSYQTATQTADGNNQGK